MQKFLESSICWSVCHGWILALRNIFVKKFHAALILVFKGATKVRGPLSSKFCGSIDHICALITHFLRLLRQIIQRLRTTWVSFHVWNLMRLCSCWINIINIAFTSRCPHTISLNCGICWLKKVLFLDFLLLFLAFWIALDFYSAWWRSWKLSLGGVLCNFFEAFWWYVIYLIHEAVSLAIIRSSNAWAVYSSFFGV